jgi:ParB-like chromosome segregation protein Spo0J
MRLQLISTNTLHMIINIPVNELLPNPHRNLKEYQIDEKRVEALVESIKASGEWPGIIARKTKAGEYQSAFGEHRKEAHRRVYGKTSNIQVILMDLDDNAMLKFMANENSETWTGSFLTVMETVEATVKAFADGTVTLPVLDKKTNASVIRYAPSFSLKKGSAHRGGERMAYTAHSVADFLGWVYPKSGIAAQRLLDALAALEYIEDGILTRRHFSGLGKEKSGALIMETRRAQNRGDSMSERSQREIEKDEREVQAVERHARTSEQKEHVEKLRKEIGIKKEAAKKAEERMRIETPKIVADALRKGTVPVKEAHKAAMPLMDELYRSGELPMFDEAIDRLAGEVSRFIPCTESEGAMRHVANDRVRIINDAIAAQSDMSFESREKLQRLRGALEGLSSRCAILAEKILPVGTKPMKAARHALTALPSK